VRRWIKIGTRRKRFRIFVGIDTWIRKKIGTKRKRRHFIFWWIYFWCSKLISDTKIVKKWFREFFFDGWLQGSAPWISGRYFWWSDMRLRDKLLHFGLNGMAPKCIHDEWLFLFQKHSIYELYNDEMGFLAFMFLSNQNLWRNIYPKGVSKWNGFNVQRLLNAWWHRFCLRSTINIFFISHTRTILLRWMFFRFGFVFHFFFILSMKSIKIILNRILSEKYFVFKHNNFFSSRLSLNM